MDIINIEIDNIDNKIIFITNNNYKYSLPYDNEIYNLKFNNIIENSNNYIFKINHNFQNKALLLIFNKDYKEIYCREINRDEDYNKNKWIRDFNVIYN
jgi:hypothetical protein